MIPNELATVSPSIAADAPYGQVVGNYLVR